MIRKLRVIVLSFFLCLSPASITSSNAAGAPVIDILNLAESIVIYVQDLVGYGQELADYATQLKDYAEQAYQSALQGSQLVQMYKDYKQVMVEYDQLMKEYNHYVNQLRGIKNFVSNAEWDYFLDKVTAKYGRSNFAVAATMDTTKSAYPDDLRKLLQNYALAPMKPADAITAFNKFNIKKSSANGTKDIEDEFTEMNKDYERYATQQEMVAISDNQLEEVEKRRIAIDDKLKSLGDESDLATLQLMATQQSLLLKQQRHLGTISNAKLQHYESLSSYAQSLKIKGYEKELKRLNRVKARNVKKSGVTNFADLGL